MNCTVGVPLGNDGGNCIGAGTGGPAMGPENGPENDPVKVFKEDCSCGTATLLTVRNELFCERCSPPVVSDEDGRAILLFIFV